MYRQAIDSPEPLCVPYSYTLEVFATILENGGSFLDDDKPLVRKNW